MLDTNFQQNVLSWKKKNSANFFLGSIIFPSSTKDWNIRKLNVSPVPLIEWLPTEMLISSVLHFILILLLISVKPWIL